MPPAEIAVGDVEPEFLRSRQTFGGLLRQQFASDALPDRQVLVPQNRFVN